MITINKKFYLFSFIILPILSVVLFFAAVWLGLSYDHVLFIGILPLIIMNVIGMVFHYKAWKAIQDGYASTSPGKAVGFLYIPVYNLYWLFRTLNGFAKDVNEYIARHEIETKDLPEGLYFLQCILIILLVIFGRMESGWAIYPTLVLLVWVYINTLIIINKSANVVNSIYESDTSLTTKEF